MRCKEHAQVKLRNHDTNSIYHNRVIPDSILRYITQNDALLAFLAEGAEYGGENLIREESLEAESLEERTADTAGGELNSQPEEEEQTSSTEQSSLDPEVEYAHMLNYMYTLSLHGFIILMS